ncbi:hypothetical protein INQ40_05595 [Lysobacter sp. H21R4]|uniref:hypothetical protein n=1 Tax=Lysobacter sp. H21R4 TaxID=2781021 RepID=UPI0018899025|nr:hypothetical protein [Lysobacter sp. H21R4]QOY63695.1 hypothetical protein INQ40_05595 [Lysobacter sp. H21R4]
MAWSKFLGYVPFFLSAFLGLSLAIGYRVLKKRRERRSPLAARQIGHVPGQQLVDRISAHETEMITSIMITYMALPLMFMGWSGSHIQWHTLRWGFLEWMYTIAAAGMFAYGLWGYAKHLHKRDRARDGLLAERHATQPTNREGVHCHARSSR